MQVPANFTQLLTECSGQVYPQALERLTPLVLTTRLRPRLAENYMRAV